MFDFFLSYFYLSHNSLEYKEMIKQLDLVTVFHTCPTASCHCTLINATNVPCHMDKIKDNTISTGFQINNGYKIVCLALPV